MICRNIFFIKVRRIIRIFHRIRRFIHDHIIRNEKDFLAVYQYIETNPLKWENDEYYT